VQNVRGKVADTPERYRDCTEFRIVVTPEGGGIRCEFYITCCFRPKAIICSASRWTRTMAGLGHAWFQASALFRDFMQRKIPKQGRSQVKKCAKSQQQRISMRDVGYDAFLLALVHRRF
jgi:hypothetical protein